jgi:hypothetical protein
LREVGLWLIVSGLFGEGLEGWWSILMLGDAFLAYIVMALDPALNYFET